MTSTRKCINIRFCIDCYKVFTQMDPALGDQPKDVISVSQAHDIRWRSTEAGPNKERKGKRDDTQCNPNSRESTLEALDWTSHGRSARRCRSGFDGRTRGL